MVLKEIRNISSTFHILNVFGGALIGNGKLYFLHIDSIWGLPECGTTISIFFSSSFSIIVRRHIAEYSSDPKNKILYGIVVRFWCNKNLVDQNIFFGMEFVRDYIKNKNFKAAERL